MKKYFNLLEQLLSTNDCRFKIEEDMKTNLKDLNLDKLVYNYSLNKIMAKINNEPRGLIIYYLNRS
jgi:hypothetical protein